VVLSSSVCSLCRNRALVNAVGVASSSFGVSFSLVSISVLYTGSVPGPLGSRFMALAPPIGGSFIVLRNGFTLCSLLLKRYTNSPIGADAFRYVFHFGPPVCYFWLVVARGSEVRCSSPGIGGFAHFLRLSCPRTSAILCLSLLRGLCVFFFFDNICLASVYCCLPPPRISVPFGSKLGVVYLKGFLSAFCGLTAALVRLGPRVPKDWLPFSPIVSIVIPWVRGHFLFSSPFPHFKPAMGWFCL